MRRVQAPAIRPHRCAAIPFITTDPKGFIDTGYDLMGWDPHVYVSVTAVEGMARMVGWVPSSQLAHKDRKINALQAELATTREQLEAAEKKLDAVDVLVGKAA